MVATAAWTLDNAPGTPQSICGTTELCHGAGQRWNVGWRRSHGAGSGSEPGGGGRYLPQHPRPGSPLTLSSAHSCNHGKCVKTGPSYVCQCAEGYGGALCDHKNDSASACSAFKCHHGQCHVSDRGEPYCLCQPGFGGEHCEQGSLLCATWRLHDPTSPSSLPSLCPL